MHPFSYNGVATPGRPGVIRRSPLDTTAAGGTKGAHSRGQALRCLRAGRGEHRSVLRTPEDADPRGENSPPPGFRPRRRGHFGDTPWLRPGGPRRDSQVPTRASCGWARDAGSPGGERGPDSRNSLQDGGGCRRAWEPARGSAGLGTSGYRMSKAGQLIVRANRGISLGNASGEPLRAPLQSGRWNHSPFCPRLSDCLSGPRAPWTGPHTK
ncbi:uncharacterized protein LOC104670118 [Rhinopithecus roxellana]|uniref:uncharacterized protein LOC104670118 n=1 Tax=Rhinopithecus roxellana TaxID=61622 RepID=UPI0005333988|nr:uncharacterized protein LOC104670118 [Rhinopithecus roxellana]